MPQKNTTDSEIVASSYQIIASRRLGYDTLMWQVPSLSFAAQAFLFTIALGASSFVARLIAASLAFVNAVISIQLMAKHRYHEEIDAHLLEALEKQYHLDKSLGIVPHAHPKLRAKTVKIKSNWIINLSSYKLWISGLMLFAGASVIIVAISIFELFTNAKVL